MIPKLFLDTDILMDFFTDREPFVNSASEIFELNERGRVQIHISAVCLNNIYYLIRKRLGHKKAIQIIEELIEITEVIGTTKEEIVQALRNDFKDFEDSVQYSCAMTIKGIDAILTRNTKDYTKSEIAVFTSENYLKTIRDER